MNRHIARTVAALMLAAAVTVPAAAGAAVRGPSSNANPTARAKVCEHNKHLRYTRYCGVKRPAPPGGYPLPAPTFPETPRPLP